MENNLVEKNTEGKGTKKEPGNMGDGKNNGIGSRDSKGEDVHRLSVSGVTEKALAAIVERVNDGFTGGRVSRTEVANWVLTNAGENLDDSAIRSIRAEYCDAFAVVEAVIRQAKASGKMPQELKALLDKHLGFDEIPKKKPKKTLTENNINDVINKDDQG